MDRKEDKMLGETIDRGQLIDILEYLHTKKTSDSNRVTG